MVYGWQGIAPIFCMLFCWSQFCRSEAFYWFPKFPKVFQFYHFYLCHFNVCRFYDKVNYRSKYPHTYTRAQQPLRLNFNEYAEPDLFCWETRAKEQKAEKRLKTYSYLWNTMSNEQLHMLSGSCTRATLFHNYSMVTWIIWNFSKRKSLTHFFF